MSFTIRTITVKKVAAQKISFNLFMNKSYPPDCGERSDGNTAIILF
jgi:hypothetical protein